VTFMPSKRMHKMLRPPAAGETRSPEELYEHYLVERDLAHQLRRSTPDQRSTLYSAVYNDLFRRFPNHPQFTRAASRQTMQRVIGGKMSLLSRFLRPETVFLEIGAGDCLLPMEVARHVRKVYALDVSAEVNKGITPPSNFKLILSNGTDIPLPPDTVDVAFSYQLMEHIHPDDAVEQLRSIYRVLAPGGVYICVTPNRLSGPHDISMYFDREATGFHLKEYMLSELIELFRRTGFERAYAYAGGRGKFVKLPAAPIKAFESIISVFPWNLRQAIAGLPAMRHLLLAAVVGVKGTRQ
jgi:SAM-dependent methyltransferase